MNVDCSWTHHDNLLQGDGRLQTANGRLGQDRPDWLQRFARQLDQVVICKVRLGGELKKHPVEIKNSNPMRNQHVLNSILLNTAQPKIPLEKWKTS